MLERRNYCSICGKRRYRKYLKAHFAPVKGGYSYHCADLMDCTFKKPQNKKTKNKKSLPQTQP